MSSGIDITVTFADGGNYHYKITDWEDVEDTGNFLKIKTADGGRVLIPVANVKYVRSGDAGGAAIRNGKTSTNTTTR